MKKRLNILLIVLSLFLMNSLTARSQDSGMSTSEETKIFLDSSYYRDSILTPCLDCFIRIGAVRKDKKECIDDNVKLNIRNEGLEKKMWNIGSLEIGSLGGFLIGVSGVSVIYLIVR